MGAAGEWQLLWPHQQLDGDQGQQDADGDMLRRDLRAQHRRVQRPERDRERENDTRDHRALHPSHARLHLLVPRHRKDPVRTQLGGNRERLADSGEHDNDDDRLHREHAQRDG